MALASLILGIVSLTGVAVAMVPLLGWLNWPLLPITAAGLILGIIAANGSAQRERGGCLPTIGIVLNCLALGFGLIRLVIGGGIV